ncbi:unnamed protein product [Rotaria magnacalcarata]|uniref:Uncharacterized protein n=1 Tax=Rotaria magnacalcarata TaxID=392030 RepID=A0A814Q9H0_9BILA|nr:unnamed protein product [Rotaria magnacalcarata]CAF4532254.1 unnamed protein product [Rotaria magnacalcarata]CAF5020145.1 unnamed protein product [Rotaria magnacalcarata]CAF5185047.1 unnamed protein product [Rotaria magnacalcarata]
MLTSSSTIICEKVFEESPTHALLLLVFSFKCGATCGDLVGKRTLHRGLSLINMDDDVCSGIEIDDISVTMASFSHNYCH